MTYLLDHTRHKSEGKVTSGKKSRDRNRDIPHQKDSIVQHKKRRGDNRFIHRLINQAYIDFRRSTD